MKKILLKTLMALSSLCFLTLSHASKDIVVGGKFFTEQYILSEITKQVLEKNGFNVTTKVGLGSNLVRKAQEQKEVDIYWEYTGTSLVAYNKVKGAFSKDETYNKVKELDLAKGIAWLKPADANNTFAIAVGKDRAEQTGIKTISDLFQKHKDEDLKIAFTAEFLGREDGLKGMQKAYDGKISRAHRKSMDSGLIYQALKDGKVDAGIIFATDGRVAAFNFIVLEDDKSYFPDYSLAAVVRTEVLEKYPEITGLMEEIADNLNDAALQKMNASVDIDKKTVEEVATEFVNSLASSTKQ